MNILTDKLSIGYLQDKKIGIFGLGMTGLSVFDYLNDQNISVICWDDNEKNRISFKNKNKLVAIEEANWKKLDVIFISPGIPLKHKVRTIARKNQIRVGSDLELFLTIMNPDAKFIAITGTNGKTTTTALTLQILETAGINCEMGGNIGLPVLKMDPSRDVYIIEISSFQLDLLPSIQADISVLLNITPDHLNHYKTYTEYRKSKMKILEGDGKKIIGINSKTSREIYDFLIEAGERNIVAVANERQEGVVSCKNGILYDDLYVNKSFELFKNHYSDDIAPDELDNNKLAGKANQENIAAAYIIARNFNILPSEIVKAMRDYKGMPHRLQKIVTWKNITYYNDSKATNTHAAAQTLASFRNVHWLAGGRFKEHDLYAIDPIFKNVEKGYFFGESRLAFAKYASNKTKYIMCRCLEEAFDKATREALQKDFHVNLILSPACSSCDEYASYEERGDEFVKFCYELDERYEEGRFEPDVFPRYDTIKQK